MTDEAEQDVAKKAKLHKIVLSSCDFEMNAAIHLDESQALIPKFARNIRAHQFEDGVAITVIEWKVRIEAHPAETAEPREELLSHSSRWVVIYTDLEGCDPEAVNSFSQQVGTMNSYPYARALFAQLAWNAGRELPIMPLLTPGFFPVISLEDLAKSQRAHAADEDDQDDEDDQAPEE